MQQGLCCQDSKMIGRSKDKEVKKSTKEQNDITVVQQYKRHVAQSCIELFGNRHVISMCSSLLVNQFVIIGGKVSCSFVVYIHVFSLHYSFSEIHISLPEASLCFLCFFDMCQVEVASCQHKSPITVSRLHLLLLFLLLFSSFPPPSFFFFSFFSFFCPSPVTLVVSLFLFLYSLFFF